jgi:hypothetical protein
MQRSLRGEINEAAVALVAKHGAQVLATARRYAATTEDAEDAYQRGLEILLTKAPTTSEDDLVPWLKTVGPPPNAPLRACRSARGAGAGSALALPGAARIGVGRPCVAFELALSPQPAPFRNAPESVANSSTSRRVPASHGPSFRSTCRHRTPVAGRHQAPQEARPPGTVAPGRGAGHYLRRGRSRATLPALPHHLQVAVRPQGGIRFRDETVRYGFRSSGPPARYRPAPCRKRGHGGRRWAWSDSVRGR